MTILETARIQLREFTPEDADALVRVLSDPKLCAITAPYDRAGVEHWIERNRQRYQDDGVGLWAMELKKTNELVGDCGIICQQVEGEYLYEIGYHLRRDLGPRPCHRSRHRLPRMAFAHLKTERLISLIRPENLPSRGVAERNGMTVWKEINWPEFTHYVYSVEKPSAP